MHVTRSLSNAPKEKGEIRKVNKAIEKFVFPLSFLRSPSTLMKDLKKVVTHPLMCLRRSGNVVDYIAWKIEIIL